MHTLTILAGPNGAGKTRSTEGLISSGLLSEFPLNIDLLENEAINQLQYDNAIDYKLPRLIDSLFRNYCIEAIHNQKDFSFECNLRKDQVQYVGLFENAGYQIHLIYFLLSSIEQSEKRVQYRFKNNEGTLVKPSNIKINFEEGIFNLDSHYQEFKKVIIIDNSHDFSNPKIQLEIINNQVTCYNKNFPPKNLVPYLPNIISLIRKDD